MVNHYYGILDGPNQHIVFIIFKQNTTTINSLFIFTLFHNLLHIYIIFLLFFLGIFKRHDCHLLAVTWNTVSDHLIAVGAADGSIALIDVRQTENPLYESVEFNRGIHKLLFNPNPER